MLLKYSGMMRVMSTTGQRPGSTLYHIGDGFYFRVNRQHFKTIYMRCASPGCKVTGSMAADLTKRNRLKTAGQHNHPPDLQKDELSTFSDRLYQRCRIENTPLRIIFQEELARAPTRIRPMLVMPHYLKRMQNLRKRLRAQSLRAKINLSQDDSVLLYEDGTPIKDEIPSSNNISLKGVHYLAPDKKEDEDNEFKDTNTLVVEIQPSTLPISDLQNDSEDSSKLNDDQSFKMKLIQKKACTHGFEWTERRLNLLLETMKHFYAEIVRHKNNPKHIWEEVAREINPDVKWYTVRKKWTQLELGYKTYIKDLKETGNQALYRPAYLEELSDIIFDDELSQREDGSNDDDQMMDEGTLYDGMNFNGASYNSDHLYTCLDSNKQNAINKNGINHKKFKNDSDELIGALLKIHREQLEESRKRMDAIMLAMEENRKESREAIQCIKRLTDAVINRVTTPGRIIVAQNRPQS